MTPSSAPSTGRVPRRFLGAGVTTIVALMSLVTAGGQAIPNQFILNAGRDLADDIVSRHALRVDDEAETEGSHVLLVSGEIDEHEELEIAEELLASDLTASFEPNKALRVTEAQSAGLGGSTAAILETLPDRTPVPYYGTTAWRGYVEQSAGRLIRLRDAQSVFGAGAGTIAVIDTAVDSRHPLFAGRVLPGFDFTRDVPGPASDAADLGGSTAAILESSTAAILETGPFRALSLSASAAAILGGSTAAILEQAGPLPASYGHGTMVAGLAHLVAPTATILPLKAFRADGTSNTFDIVRAVYYAVDQGARVINMSFTMPESSPALYKAIQYATSRGVLSVSAAGNESQRDNVYPAAYSKTAGVASTTDADTRSDFSNYGSFVTIAAPGERLITAFPGGRYAAVWGTSFSSGLVAGGAAVLVQRFPQINQSDFENALAKGARRLTDDLGRGRLNLYRSLMATAR